MAIDTVTDTTPTGKMDFQDSYSIVRGEQREIQRYDQGARYKDTTDSGTDWTRNMNSTSGNIPQSTVVIEYSPMVCSVPLATTCIQTPNFQKVGHALLMLGPVLLFF